MCVKIKTTMSLAFASTLWVSGASNCIVSGDLARPATHSVVSASSASAFDMRGGSSGSAVHVATPTDEFEARAWSQQDSAVPCTLNCLPPAMMIIIR